MSDKFYVQNLERGLRRLQYGWKDKKNAVCSEDSKDTFFISYYDLIHILMRRKSHCLKILVPNHRGGDEIKKHSIKCSMSIGISEHFHLVY